MTLITALQKLEPELLHAVSENVVWLKGVTVIDCVVWPLGLHEYDVGLLVQFAVNSTGVPGVTGVATVAGGEALIVQTGGTANAGPQSTNMIAKTNAFASGRKSAQCRDPDTIATESFEWPAVAPTSDFIFYLSRF